LTFKLPNKLLWKSNLSFILVKKWTSFVRFWVLYLTLKEVPENRNLFEILADDQSHGCNLRVDVIKGLSFTTRGNVVKKTDQVVDKFTVDHIREDFEFEQKLAPNLDVGNFPQGGVPFMLVSIIVAR
jgi:hypothetical protein